MPEVIRRLRVLYEQDGAWNTVCTVENNYQRFCRLDLGGIQTKRLRMELSETNGSEFASIYSISAYAPDTDYQ